MTLQSQPTSNFDIFPATPKLKGSVKGKVRIGGAEHKYNTTPRPVLSSFHIHYHHHER